MEYPRVCTAICERGVETVEQEGKTSLHIVEKTLFEFSSKS